MCTGSLRTREGCRRQSQGQYKSTHMAEGKPGQVPDVVEGRMR